MFDIKKDKNSQLLLCHKPWNQGRGLTSFL